MAACCQRLPSHAARRRSRPALRVRAASSPPPAPPAPSDATCVAFELGGGLTLLHCATSERPRVELEFSLGRGSSDNTYLLRGSAATALLDVPEAHYVPRWTAALAAAGGGAPDFLVLTHFSPRRAEGLAALLAQRPASARPLEVWCSNPAAQLLRQLLAEGPGQSAALAAAWRGAGGLRARLRTVRGGDSLPLGGRALAFAPAPTPRWPDALLVHDGASRVLFTGKLFGAHVAGARAAADSPLDAGGWDAHGEDWRFYFEALLAPVAAQARALLERLRVSAEAEAAPPPPPPSLSLGARLLQLDRLLLEAGREALKALAAPRAPGAAPPPPPPGFAAATLAPLHGPVVRGSVAELLGRYEGWLAAQAAAAEEATVAVLFASAYGNTGAMAQALCRGITKAGAGAELLNVEFASAEEVQAAVRRAGGFALGSPTLGGHMPTPVKQSLGAILQLPEARQLPCGVFGSFGWSGEAVDELQARLVDGGFAPAFEPLRCKFAPTPATLQACEEAGTDLAQAALREARRRSAARARGAADGAAAEAAGGASRDALAALGRVVGSLCVLTAARGDARSAMLASWVSQAAFDPPQLTVAVAKERAAEGLALAGAPFVLNVLAAGRERAVSRALLRPFGPGEDRFKELRVRNAPGCGAPVLEEAAAYLECRVTARMDAGDHWVLLADVQAGEVQLEEALTAMHFRKSGKTY